MTTPPENSESPEPEAEGDAERTTVFSAKDVLGGGDSNGSGDGTMSPPPWQRVNTEAPTEWPGSSASSGQPGAAPTAGSAGGSNDQPTVSGQQTGQGESEDVLYSGRGANVDWASAQTITTERPVVSGSAAARLFGDGQDEPPPSAASSVGAGERTAVDLGNAGRTSAQSGTPSALRRPGRGPRRANLQVKRIDPWSVLKLSLVLGVALFFVWLVAVGVLYIVLEGMGVWDKLNGTYSQLVQDGAGGGSEALITPGSVFGVAAIIGVINIVLMAALATVMSFVYNVSADLAGGLELTLSERE